MLERAPSPVRAHTLFEQMCDVRARICNPFSCTDESGPCCIHSTTDVGVNDAEYVILAEREGPEFILHRVEPVGERLYHLNHHDGIPQALDRIERVM